MHPGRLAGPSRACTTMDPMLDVWLERIAPRLSVDEETGCWRWPGATNGRGYGRVTVDGRPLLVHRIAHELFVGPIPEGLHVDHVHARGCRHRDCANPAHLEAVTVAENKRRGRQGLLWTMPETCKYGHALTGDNLGPGHGMTRWNCRACRRESKARSRARARERALGTG